MSHLTVAACVLGVLAAWLVVGMIVALVVGRIVRARDLQVPDGAEAPGETGDDSESDDHDRLHRLRNGPR